MEVDLLLRHWVLRSPVLSVVLRQLLYVVVHVWAKVAKARSRKIAADRESLDLEHHANLTPNLTSVTLIVRTRVRADSYHLEPRYTLSHLSLTKRST